MSVEALILIGLFILFVGWMWGNSKKGFMVYKTNELPQSMFTVVYTDKVRTVLCEIGPKKRNFLITTEAFGGKPIRAKDTVRMTTGPKEMKELGIKSLGYPPLVKEICED
jgi:hypothetical protein